MEDINRVWEDLAQRTQKAADDLIGICEEYNNRQAMTDAELLAITDRIKLIIIDLKTVNRRTGNYLIGYWMQGGNEDHKSGADGNWQPGSGRSCEG